MSLLGAVPCSQHRRCALGSPGFRRQARGEPPVRPVSRPAPIFLCAAPNLSSKARRLTRPRTLSVLLPVQPPHQLWHRHQDQRQATLRDDVQHGLPAAARRGRGGSAAERVRRAQRLRLRVDQCVSSAFRNHVLSTARVEALSLTPGTTLAAPPRRAQSDPSCPRSASAPSTLARRSSRCTRCARWAACATWRRS